MASRVYEHRPLNNSSTNSAPISALAASALASTSASASTTTHSLANSHSGALSDGRAEVSTGRTDLQQRGLGVAMGNSVSANVGGGGGGGGGMGGGGGGGGGGGAGGAGGSTGAPGGDGQMQPHQQQGGLGPHPSAARLNDLLEFVKAEFEQVSGESGLLRAQREEYEAMINHHANELNAMRAMSYDLERKHIDEKRSLQDENSRLHDEQTRLQRALDSAGLTSLPSSAPRPNLPTLNSGGNSGPTASSSIDRPTSSAGGTPSVGHGRSNNFFARESLLPSAQSEREGSEHGGSQGGYGGREGEGPSKRMRMENSDDRHNGPLTPLTKKPMGSYTKSMTPTNFPNAPTHVLSRPPSTTPLYSHSSPVPTPSLPPLPISIPTFNSNPRSDGASPTHSNGHAANGNGGVEATVKEEEGGEFDPETVPKDLKKEGSDWLTMFNPNVKRVLDVGLVHTLVHDSVVCCVRFSPDGKVLATGCNRNTTLYDTKTGAKISVLYDESSGLKVDNYIRSASFSPDGKLLATGSEDRIVRIWNIAQKRIAKVFQGHKSEIYSLAFSPDGRRLVSGSGDKTAKMWDMETGTCVFTLTIEDTPIVGATGADPTTVDAGVTSVVMSPDGKYLAAGSLDTVVRIWDASTGTLLDKLKGHKDSVYSVAFSPDGKFLVSGSLDKTLKMWDMASLEAALGKGGKEPVKEGGKTFCMTTLQGHKDYVLSVDISPDGAWIVSGSKDRGVQFWDPKTAKAQFMLQGHKNSVISVAVSDVGGLVATGSGDWSARIWSYERNA